MHLQKKIGPLPLWAWILIVGTAGGLLWYEHDQSSSSSTSGASTSSLNQVDPSNPLGLTYAQEEQDETAGIDPTTGESYADEQMNAAGDYGSSDYPGGDGLSDATDQLDEVTSLLAAVGKFEKGLQPKAKHWSEKLKDGDTIFNFKPKAKKGETIKGIGHGLYEAIPDKKKQKSKPVKKKTTQPAKHKKVTATRHTVLQGAKVAGGVK